MKIFALAFLSLLLACSQAAAQGALTVGEEVRYRCNCLGQEWIKATVERIGGGNARMRFGNMDNQVVTLPVDSPLIRREGPVESPQAGDLRKSFAAQVAPRYRRTVEQFAQFYDSQFLPAGGPVRPAEWLQAMTELAELDSLCRGPYRGVTDFPADYTRPGSVDYRFSTWCQMAAGRAQLEPRARAGMAKLLVNLGYTDENLNFGFSEQGNPVRMETQQLIWDRAKWRADKIVWLKPKYAEYGATVPPDAFGAVEKRSDELRAIVERDAPRRSWKQPPHHDPAVEAVIKAKFAAQYPGSQVLKIGLDYNTWVARKSLTYVASDEIFNYYKVSYNSYKRGSALLKIPGRPFCQMQDWVVGRNGASLVPVAVGGSGTFMRCQ